MKIKDMQVGSKISDDLVLTEATIRKTKTNKDYLQLSLSDGTDKLDGKIWDYNAARGVPELKKVYTVSGQIGEFMGKKQIILESIVLCKDQNLCRFVPVCVDDIKFYYDGIMEMAGKIYNDALRTVVQQFYSLYISPLCISTSARGVHHTGTGGNLVHTYEVAKIAAAVTDALVLSHIDYVINRDVVIAGAIMHDVGKAWTYNMEDPGMSYTRLGREQDHIIIGIRKLDEFLLKHRPDLYVSEEAALLQHIIASHHGTLEKGSPVMPNFIEAMIVNYADGISASVNAVWSYNTKAVAEGKETTDKVWVMGNHEMTLQRDILNLSEEEARLHGEYPDT